jgi:hypothetical protein
MRSTLRFLLPAAAALALCGVAPRQAAAQQTVTCQSTGYDRTYCQVDTRGGVVLSRNLSNSPCVAGRSWGTVAGRGIWVSNGCRAEFRVNNGYNNNNGVLTRRGNVNNNRRANRDVNGNGNVNGNRAENLCRRAAASRIGRNVGAIGILGNGTYQNTRGGWHINWADNNSRMHGSCTVNTDGNVSVNVQR